MEALHQFELILIEMLQSAGKFLAAPMSAVTFLGDQTFYLIFMPMIYWCVDAFAGLRIGVMLLFSAFGNGFIKMIFKSPRPYWVSDQILAGAEHESFGLPSGHAMNSASVWGWTAREINKAWAKWALGLLIFLIGFSRIVLGVHFISDVLLGWLLGALLVWAFSKVLNSIGKVLQKMSLSRQLLLAALSSALIVFLPALVDVLSGDWQMPTAWTARSGLIDPMNLDFALTTAGLWLGMLAGFALLYHQKGVLESGKGGWHLIVRYLLGMAGVIILYAGLGALFPKELGLVSYVLRYLRYLLIGLWVSWIGPLLFEKLKIATIQTRPEQKSEVSS